MKNNFFKILLIISIIIIAGCFTTGTAFAASFRWFGAAEKKDNNAAVDSWIKVIATPAEGFDSDEEYIAEFTVKHWAENNNYKLVLSGVDFFCPSKPGTLDPDVMWEYYADGGWAPVSEAQGLELIPVVTLKTCKAYLKIRIKPGFFENTGFEEYLDYYLELTAELLSL